MKGHRPSHAIFEMFEHFRGNSSSHQAFQSSHMVGRRASIALPSFWCNPIESSYFKIRATKQLLLRRLFIQASATQGLSIS